MKERSNKHFCSLLQRLGLIISMLLIQCTPNPELRESRFVRTFEKWSDIEARTDVDEFKRSTIDEEGETITQYWSMIDSLYSEVNKDPEYRAYFDTAFGTDMEYRKIFLAISFHDYLNDMHSTDSSLFSRLSIIEYNKSKRRGVNDSLVNQRIAMSNFSGHTEGDTVSVTLPIEKYPWGKQIVFLAGYPHSNSYSDFDDSVHFTGVIIKKDVYRSEVGKTDSSRLSFDIKLISVSKEDAQESKGIYLRKDSIFKLPLQAYGRSVQ